MPETITEDFFPLVLGSWWEFDTYLPGFPDKPICIRFQMQPPDEKGCYPIQIKSLNLRTGVRRGSLRLRKLEGLLRMIADGEPVDLLRFGARIGDTWAYQPKKPQYRARLAEIRYERILGEWRPVARVSMHAGDVDSEIVKEYYFASGLGWVRFTQSRTMGSLEKSFLKNALVPMAHPSEE